MKYVLKFFLGACLLINSPFVLAQKKQGNLSSVVQISNYTTSAAISSSILATSLGGMNMFRWRMGATDSNGEKYASGGMSIQTRGGNSEGFLAGSAASSDTEDSPWSIWGTPVVSDFENKIAPLTSQGSIGIGLLGVEYRHEDDWIGGVSIGFDRLTATTLYNDGDLTGKGYTIAPYFVYQPTPTRAIDASFGLGKSNFNSVVGSVISAPVDDRKLVSLGITDVRQFGKFVAMLKGSYSIVSDEIAAFNSSDGQSNEATSTLLKQFKIGGQLSRTFGMATPFIAYYFLLNDFSANGGILKPVEYSEIGQLQFGVNVSKGMFFGSLSSQMEKDRRQLRLYVGVRY